MRFACFRFTRSEEGAVTVDWVVLTAAIVGLCIGAYTLMENATLDLTSGTSDFMATRSP